MEPTEHVLRCFRSECERGRSGLQNRAQFGEGEPDCRGASVTNTLGVDEDAFRLDAEEGAQKFRHATVRLMRYDCSRLT